MNTTHDEERSWAVITGATRGIGSAIAARLASDGFAVMLVGRSPDALTEAQKEITRQGGIAETFQCDLSDRASLARCCQDLVSAHPAVHVLVNNAGVSYSAPFAAHNSHDFDSLFEVNVRAVFELTRLLHPALLSARPGASIVNVSSVLGVLAMPLEAAYIASKGAINQLTKALAVELGPLGIRVNAVAPGFIETEMFTLTHEVSEQSAIAMAHPIGRVGRAEEVAAAVSFLCSPDASFVSGAVLAVDGGLSSALAVPVGQPQ